MTISEEEIHIFSIDSIFSIDNYYDLIARPMILPYSAGLNLVVARF